MYAYHYPYELICTAFGSRQTIPTIIITGKGNHSKNDRDVYSSKDLGKLRFSVPEYINSDKEISKLIVSVSGAEPKDGGDGAILIRLRNL